MKKRYFAQTKMEKINIYMLFFICMVVWGPTISFISENNSHAVAGAEGGGRGRCDGNVSLMPQQFPYYTHSRTKRA